MLHSYLYAEYTDPMDFFGKNLIGLTDAPRATVRAMIPLLREKSEMRRRWAFTRALKTFNTGEIADEVHEFRNAMQGNFRLMRILFKRGRVIELSLQPLDPRKFGFS